jgi:hypothetical protein
MSRRSLLSHISREEKLAMKRMFMRLTLLGLSFLLFLISSSAVFDADNTDQYATAANQEFYALRENSIDVVFVGASSFYMGLIPLQMWQEYGFTAFLRTAAEQPSVVSYYKLEETLEYQRPSLVVLDVSTLYRDPDLQKLDARIRQAVEPMRYSLQKYRIIQYLIDQGAAQTWASFVFPVLRYHARWSELTKADYAHPVITPASYRGFPDFYFSNEEINPEDFLLHNGDPKMYSEDSLYFYQKMIELCQQNDIDVLFVAMPREDWSLSKHKGIQQLADQYNLDYLDYNLPEYSQAAGISVTTDLYDLLHLNYRGAQKITAHLGAYIRQNYHLPDHKGDPTYAQWDIDLQKFLDEYERALQEYEAAQEKAGK